MARILKYTISEEHTILKNVSNVLSAENQKDTLVVYVTESDEPSLFEIIWLPTGANGDLSKYTFLNTVMLNDTGFVAHVFYRKL